MEETFYFEGGINLKTIFAGNEYKNLKLAEKTLQLSLTGRDGFIRLSGGENEVKRGLSFFNELSRFAMLRKLELDQRDFEDVCRAFREGAEHDLPALWKEKISVGARKKDVFPRSVRQLDYIRSIKTRDLIFGVGPAGTGKTYLAMAMAVSEFLSGRVNRIVLTRPARESGENLGFLPGSLEEKILPYLRPLYDALYDMLSPDEARDLVERGIIEVAPLAFMRGRTLNNSFIILDEAQNTTVEQMFMLLTRMGYNSKCVVTGDPTQNDLKNDERSGLLHAINTLSGISEIAICRFNTSDVVRNSLLEKIINAYNKPESGVEEL